MANKEDTFVMQDALEEYAKLDKQRLLGYDEGEGDEKTHVNGVKDDLEKYTDEAIGEVEETVEGLDGRLTTVEDDYLTSEDKSELEEKISQIPKFDVQVVEKLPTEDISTSTVYLVTEGNDKDNDNMYTEYIYVEHTVDGVTTYTWEKLGEQNFDLADYYTATEVEAKLAEKVDTGDFETLQKELYGDDTTKGDIDNLESDIADLKNDKLDQTTADGLYQSKGNYVETTTSTGNILKDRDQLILQRDTGDTNNTSFIAQNADGGEKVYFGIGSGEQGSSNMGVYRNDSKVDGQWLVRWDKNGQAQFDPSHSYGDATHPIHFESGTPVPSTDAVATQTDLANKADASDVDDIIDGTTKVGKAKEAETAQTANSVEQLNNSLTLEGNDSFSFDGSQPEPIPLATESQSGLMSAEDKANLDKLVSASGGTSLLETASWEEIATASKSGIASSLWAVGDTKTVHIQGTMGTVELNNDYLVYIIGFDHNADLQGTGKTYFQGFKTVDGVDIGLIDGNYNSTNSDGTLYFNVNHWGSSSSPYNTNYGGWAACDIRYDILGSTDNAPSPYGSTKTTDATGVDPSNTCATSPKSGTLMSCLSSDLRVVMARVTLYTDNKGNSSNVESGISDTVDYLFLLSEYEVQGARTYANTYEQNYQARFTYYANGNSKIKYRHTATGSTAYWWCRSPYYTTAYYFCYVNTTGGASSYTSRYSYAVAPAFAV